MQAKKREGELASKVSTMESEMQTYQAQAAQAAQSAEDLKSQLAVRGSATPACPAAARLVVCCWHMIMVFSAGLTWPSAACLLAGMQIAGWYLRMC